MAEEAKIVKYDYEGEFITNTRGMKLFTCRWRPVNRDPKALIFLLHGYALECSTTLKHVGIRLAKSGYAVYGLDCEGHGKSAGLPGYIDKFDDVVDDCCDYFTKICGKEEYKEKRRFLYGESMGGAAAILMHGKMPDYWDGAVLAAPMCKIAEDLKPNQFLVKTFDKLCKIFPTWKAIAPREAMDVSVKDPEKRAMVRSSPYIYKGRIRLKTGNQLFYASAEVEKILDQITIPFLVVHGGEDTLLDPMGSKQLYDVASSTDKTYKFYPDMCHALVTGEMPENINIVLSDIIQWLDERAAP